MSNEKDITGNERELWGLLGVEAVNAMQSNIKISKELAEQMKIEFDQHVPIEESIVKIFKKHGQGMALSASMQFLAWFITERVPTLRSEG